MLNGTPIIENNHINDLPDEHREDLDALIAPAMDTFGAISALRALESVTADGHHWIARERARTLRHIIDYTQRVGGAA